MKARPAIVALLAAAAMSSAAWSEELRIGIKTETSSIDPHWQTLIVNIQIDRHFFDHLIEVGDSMELKPGLATEWQAIDETTWEFKLREGRR